MDVRTAWSPLQAVCSSNTRQEGRVPRAASRRPGAGGRAGGSWAGSREGGEPRISERVLIGGPQQHRFPQAGPISKRTDNMHCGSKARSGRRQGRAPTPAHSLDCAADDAVEEEVDAVFLELDGAEEEVVDEVGGRQLLRRGAQQRVGERDAVTARLTVCRGRGCRGSRGGRQLLQGRGATAQQWLGGWARRASQSHRRQPAVSGDRSAKALAVAGWHGCPPPPSQGL